MAGEVSSANHLMDKRREFLGKEARAPAKIQYAARVPFGRAHI